MDTQKLEEAQAGALVQLITIAQQQRTLTEFIKRFEAQADADPKNVKSLETLVQIYTLTRNTGKAKDTIERLVAASPNDPVYQSMWLSRSIGQNSDYETLKKSLDEMTGLTPEARFWYIAQYASNFYRQGQKEDAEKLAAELEGAKVTDLKTGARIVNTLTQMGKTAAAEKVSLPSFPYSPLRNDATTAITEHLNCCPLFGQLTSTSQQWQEYRRYLSKVLRLLIFVKGQSGQSGIALFWTFFERTKPQASQCHGVSPP